MQKTGKELDRHICKILIWFTIAFSAFITLMMYLEYKGETPFLLNWIWVLSFAITFAWGGTTMLVAAKYHPDKVIYQKVENNEVLTRFEQYSYNLDESRRATLKCSFKMLLVGLALLTILMIFFR